MERLIASRVFHPRRPLPEFPCDGVDADAVCDAARRAGVACAVFRHTNPALTLLFFHGNAEDLETCAPYAEELRDAFAATVYVCEYPGYWRPPGAAKPVEQPSEEGVYVAARVALAAVREHAPSLPVAVMGYSLGSAAAIHAVAEAQDGAIMLILVAPLLGALATALGNSAPLAFLYRPLDMFRTDRTAARVTGPAIVCHGTKARNITPRDARNPDSPGSRASAAAHRTRLFRSSTARSWHACSGRSQTPKSASSSR